MKRIQAHGFGVLTSGGSILTTDGSYHKPLFVGPGGYSAKVWKTRAGAQKRADHIHGSVFAVTKL